jgi:hypothetical protein
MIIGLPRVRRDDRTSRGQAGAMMESRRARAWTRAFCTAIVVACSMLLHVPARAADDCQVAANPFSFGPYDTVNGTPGTMTLTVTCDHPAKGSKDLRLHPQALARAGHQLFDAADDRHRRHAVLQPVHVARVYQHLG